MSGAIASTVVMMMMMNVERLVVIDSGGLLNIRPIINSLHLVDRSLKIVQVRRLGL